jgi:hypothetical protein
MSIYTMTAQTETTKIEAFRKGFKLYRLTPDGRWVNQGYFPTREAAEAARG